MDERARRWREVLKSAFPALRAEPSDQDKQLPQPPLEKPAAPNASFIQLPAPESCVLAEPDIYACIKRRRSRRSFSQSPLTLDQLAFLLWASQGVQRVFGKGYSTFRPVPSAGARHAFETYLVVRYVDGLAPGVYRYLPLSHRLELLFPLTDEFSRQLRDAVAGQAFVVDTAVLFIWSCVPYRMEWRYHAGSPKLTLIDAGHVCQNLYLACEAIGCGTCAVAEYHQEALDSLLHLDGSDEFVIYMAPVGKSGRSR